MLSYGHKLTFADGDPQGVVMDGFWPVEDGFVWSRGKFCEIRFPFHVSRATPRSDLVIDLDVYHPQDIGQSVLVYLNGLRLGSKFVLGRVTLVFNFASDLLLPEDNLLILDTPDVMSPSQFGSADKRSLAAQIFAIQIRPC